MTTNVKLSKGTDRYNVTINGAKVGWVSKSGRAWQAYNAEMGRVGVPQASRTDAIAVLDQEVPASLRVR